jgi:hypothetical protein
MVKLRVASGITQFGKFLESKSFNAAAGTFSPALRELLDAPASMPQYLNTSTAQQVTNIGDFFGKDVSPFTAAEWSRRIK